MSFETMSFTIESWQKGKVVLGSNKYFQLVFHILFCAFQSKNECPLNEFFARNIK